MKHSFFLCLSVISVFTLVNSACTSQKETESVDLSQLNVDASGMMMVDSSEKLSQIITPISASANSLSKEVASVQDIQGSSILAQTVLHIGSRYVFIKGFGKSHQPDVRSNIILDLSNGKVVPLEQWPSYPNKVVVNSTHAFFVSDGSIFAVNLANGSAELVSSSGPYWENSSSGYKMSYRFWGDPWVYVDSSSNVYAVEYHSLSNGNLNIGGGGKYLYSGGHWIEDTHANQTFFPSMDYSISNAIPGSLLAGNYWMIVDEETGALYQLHTYNSTAELRSYNLDTWSVGQIIQSIQLPESTDLTTYIGINNSINNGFITNGHSILRFKSNAGVLSAEVIPVYSGIPVMNYILSPGGYTNYWAHGAVANWKYAQGSLIYYNPSNEKIYLWDLDVNHAPIKLGSLPWINFPFKQ